eukprot:XP_001692237.1 predicted protein [Chlamydomonas reinhardtii]
MYVCMCLCVSVYGVGMAAAPTYLVDFACYRPADELKVVATEVEEAGKHWPMYSEGIKDFLWKVLLKSGLSTETTFLPKAVHPCHTRLPDSTVPTALEEARVVMVGAIDELLGRVPGGLDPAADIDILITSNSIFCSTPSLASMVVNHYKLRPDIQVSYCMYPGKDKARMVANAIFRPSQAARAKYVLQHALRVHTGASDASYTSMHWSPDEEGINGIYLDKCIIEEAGKCIEMVMRGITPKIMTWRQYGEAAAHVISTASRQLLNRRSSSKPTAAASKAAVTAAAAAKSQQQQEMMAAVAGGGKTGASKAGGKKALALTATSSSAAVLAVPSKPQAAAAATNAAAATGKNAEEQGQEQGQEAACVEAIRQEQEQRRRSDNGTAWCGPAPACSSPASASTTASTGSSSDCGSSPASLSPAPSETGAAAAGAAAGGGATSGVGKGGARSLLSTVRSAVLGALASYRPDYTACVDHFLVHAGGYAVLKGLQSELALPDAAMIPSFAALREYGNTSASTTWYALGYTEACEGVRRGQGGCNVWRALRDVDGSSHTAWRHLGGRRLSEAELPRGITRDVVRARRGVA